MDYFKGAFGDFSPHADPVVAAKFVINAVFMDERFDELASLLTDGHDIGGIEGEPGWTIERRDTAMPADEPYYQQWPEGAVFRVFVDPDSFELGQPEVYLERQNFHRLVRKAVSAMVTKNPSSASKTDQVSATLSAQEKGTSGAIG
ncbi:hypothetical protein KY495_12070 [Massilia sp. PAMC28688]|uniref:hypothetical protein n=1 Tax=Massilia sp. PAMC28688 TaxID=2861283 RepID=UPI001C635801|nr:hypothetical protein [Massilia sp. PAMC28688]QYF95822.1 hypothetical protein KY495_12070 [Massilia sp. PAMC28688]